MDTAERAPLVEEDFVEKYKDKPEQVRQRYELRENLLEAGSNPYRNDLKPEHTAQMILAEYDKKSKEELEGDKVQVSVAGRIMGLRSFGKSAFIRLKDRSGEIQIFSDKNSLSEDEFKVFKKLQVGDIIFASGHLFRTKTDHLTIHAGKMALLTKSLRPLPEKFHGLTNIELRYRQRYLDLIMNPEVMDIFRIRSQVITELRHFLIERDYMEVETPMLHAIQGGTIAKPFKTHHNALDIPLYLRIAPELYLKRLVVGGMEKVFEINRNFRNEGISIKHNPEFTLLEFYETYSTYEDLIPLTEEMIKHVVDKVLGQRTFTYQGTEINVDGQWNRMTVEDAIVQYSGFKDKEKLRDREALLSYAKGKKYPVEDKMPTGELMMTIFDEEVEENLVQPTFVTHYPVDVSPLARRTEADPFVTDRFELYIYGREIANAFSELNDPVDQAGRFETQMEERLSGNEEACEMDEDYIKALEIGLPPTAGEGIGIDRLVMLLSDSASIRDVILFPLLKPHHEE